MRSLRVLVAAVFVFVAGQGFAIDNVVKRVAHVTVSGIGSPYGEANGTYELWDEIENGGVGIGQSYWYEGHVGTRRYKISVIWNQDTEEWGVNFYVMQGMSPQQIYLGHYESSANPTLAATCTYTTKESMMPTTCTLDLVAASSSGGGGGGGGSVSISNFGSDPSDSITPTNEPDLPDPDDEDAPTAPTYTYHFPSDPFSGGTESEYPTPRPGDLPIEWNPFEFDEFEDETLTFNIPMPDVMFGHGAPYLRLSTNPFDTFGTANGNVFGRLDTYRMTVRLILSLCAFFVFSKAVVKTLVFA